ncbi:MAG: MFS transporter [Endozoicomonas sp.]
MTRKTYWNILIGAMLVGAVGGMYMLSITQIVTSLVSEWGFTDQQAGIATAMHTLGSLVGMTYIFIKIDTLNIHKWMVGALTATVVCEAAIALSGQPELVIAVRLFAGFASGLAFATALALMGYLPNNERIFALSLLLSFISAILVMYFWPALLNIAGMSGIFWYFSAYALICLPFIKLLPAYTRDISSNTAQEQDLDMSDLFRGAPLVIIIASLLFYTGNTAIWTFAGQIGVSQGLSLAQATETLSYSMVAGFIASIIATVIGNRQGYTISFLAGLGTITISTLMMLDMTTADAYLLAFALFNFGFSFAIPYIQGLQSKFDPSGRLLILGLMTISAGFFMGPAIASLILDDGDYSNLFWLGFGCFALSLVLIQTVVFRSLGLAGREAPAQ